jgi:hypothetical protein
MSAASITPPGKVLHIGLHLRLQRGVDRRRGGAAIFAQGRVEPVRQRIGHAGQHLGDQLAELFLMRRVDDRPEQADGDRLDALLLQRRQYGARRRLVEAAHLAAIGEDAAGDFEGQGARHIGFGEWHGEIERLHAATLAKHEDVAVALGGEERRLRGVAGDDGVDRMRRAVDEQAAGAEQIGERPIQTIRRDLQRIEHTANRIVRRCRRLEHVQTAIVILDDEVGKRPPGIDRKPHD